MYVCKWEEGKDAFTCVSSKGSSVVDYCIVPWENLKVIEEFSVVTMLLMESIDEMKQREEPLRMPDHSLLLWEVVWEDAEVWEDVERVQVEAPKSRMRYKVPKGYLEKDRQTVQKLVERIRRMGEG